MKQPDTYPFNVTQNALAGGATSWDRHSDVIEQRPNVPFDAEMKIISLVRGRSSTVFMAYDMESKTGYEIHSTDFLSILKAQIIDRGLVSGKWYVRKRNGGYFGLAMVDI